MKTPEQIREHVAVVIRHAELDKLTASVNSQRVDEVIDRTAKIVTDEFLSARADGKPEHAAMPSSNFICGAAKGIIYTLFNL